MTRVNNINDDDDDEDTLQKTDYWDTVILIISSGCDGKFELHYRRIISIEKLLPVI